MNEEKKAELKTDLTDLRHAALDLAHEAMAERSAEFDARLQAAREQAELDEMERRTNPPRVVAEDGTSRSVLEEAGFKSDGKGGMYASTSHVDPMALQPGTAPKVTPADIEAEIASEHYYTAGEAAASPRAVTAYDQDGLIPAPLYLLTHCVLVLRNGFTVTGESDCASQENFDADVGRKVARAAAVAKCWPLMGFALRNELTGHRPMATTPVLDTSKLPERYVVPANLRASALEESKPSAAPVEIEFTVIPNPCDFGHVVVAQGQRNGVKRTEQEPAKQPRPSDTDDDRRRHITQAKQRAAERVNAWFAMQGDDRQQDA